MTTHPRAWLRRAGVVMALAVGTVALTPVAAQAADTSVQIVSLAPGTIGSEGVAKLKFRVTNNTAERALVSAQVNPGLGELRCEGTWCNFSDELNPGQSKEYEVDLKAAKLEPGQDRSGTVRIEARLTDRTGDPSRTGAGIKVEAPDQRPSATQVSGKVLDADTSEPVAGANVAMTDNAGQKWDARTGGNGSYKFVGTPDKPITPGRIQIGAVKDGYQVQATGATAVAGKPLTVRLMIKSNTPPSPTATPSASAEPTAAPSEEASADALAAPQAPPATTNTAAPEDGNSWTLVLVGGLLVAAGIGAIVLLLMRRKDADAEGADDAPATAAGAGAAAVPASQGVYHGAPDATQVAGRGAASDATMVTGGIPPSLADAPTMLQRAVPANPADEFPDPYGAPLPQQHGPVYGAAGMAAAQPGAWGNPGYAGAAGAAGAVAAAGATAAAPANGAYQQPAVPHQPGGYGAAAQPGGGYGGPPAQRQEPQYGSRDYPPPSEPSGYPPAPGAPAQRYDEPTGRYEPPAGGYPEQNGGPQPSHAARGYEADSGYPSAGYPAAPASGYGSASPAGGYGPAAPAGGYGPGAPAGGYGAAPAAGGYGAADAGHGAPATASGGYGAGDGGYGAPGTANGDYHPPSQYGAQPARGYEAPQAGYGQAAGAGGYQPGGGEPAGGYGASAHGQPGTGTGYVSGPANGHDAGHPYERSDGYDPRGGYDHVPGQPSGYDRTGQYGGEPGQQPQSRHGAGQQPGQPPVGEQRRPLDWLDD